MTNEMMESVYQKLRENLDVFMQTQVSEIVNDANAINLDWDAFFSIDEATGRPTFIDDYLKNKITAELANLAQAAEYSAEETFNVAAAFIAAAIMEKLLDITDPPDEESEPKNDR